MDVCVHPSICKFQRCLCGFAMPSELSEIVRRIQEIIRLTNPRSLPRPTRAPFDRAPFVRAARTSRALVVSGILWPQMRRASVCGSALALRSGSAPAVAPPVLHFSPLPTAHRSVIRIISSWDDFIAQNYAHNATSGRDLLTYSPCRQAGTSAFRFRRLSRRSLICVFALATPGN